MIFKDKVDFDYYNDETAMLSNQKYCDKDENGQPKETHFLDCVVNAYMLEFPEGN